MIDFYCESIQVSESTVKHNVDVLSRVFRDMEPFGIRLNEESIDGLSGASLQRWFNAYRKDRKETTVNNVVVTLNPFLRWAHKIYPDGVGDFGGILKTLRLPDYDRLPEEDRPKDKYYSHEQIAELLQIPGGRDDSPLKKRDRAIIAMYLATGLRASELSQLRIGSLTDHGHGYVYVRRKGGAWKTTEVAEFAYPYIETYLRTRKDRNDPDAYLFITTHGQPCNPNQLYKSMRHRQSKVSGAESMGKGSHALRHTFVSEAEKAGGGAVARDLANHKSLAITNRYDHSTAAQRRVAVDSLRYGIG